RRGRRRVHVAIAEPRDALGEGEECAEALFRDVEAEGDLFALRLRLEIAEEGTGGREHEEGVAAEALERRVQLPRQRGGVVRRRGRGDHGQPEAAADAGPDADAGE